MHAQPQRPPVLVPLLSLSGRSSSVATKQTGAGTQHGERTSGRLFEHRPISVVPVAPTAFFDQDVESGATEHRGTPGASRSGSTASVTPVARPYSATSKSPLHRKFLDEVRARAVRAPTREDAAGAPPFTVPQSFQDTRGSSTSFRPGSASMTRTRPVSAAMSRASTVKSRVSALSGVSATQLHTQPPLLHVNGQKQGVFVKLQSQYDVNSGKRTPVGHVTSPVEDSLTRVRAGAVCTFMPLENVF